MRINLLQDHRLFNYETTFGSTTTFSPTLIVDAGFLDVQPIGDVSCTCYTADKVKSGDTGKRYDHTWLWAKMVQARMVVNNGASPQDAFGMAVKGQRVVPTGEIDTSVAYFQCELGQYDFFTNVKSAIQMEYNKGLKRPVGVGTYWYREWLATPPNGVMLEGKTIVSAHEWEVCGWDAEHPDCFKIDAHIGYYLYMPKDVFNKAMDATYGSVALTLAETEQERIDFLKETQYSLLRRIIDFLTNILIGLKQKAVTKPVITPSELNKQVIELTTPKEEFPRYQWTTIEQTRKSIRIICDEEKLTLLQKNLTCDICACESGFNIKAKGRVDPRDRGLFQWNSKYHPEITDEIAFNPEKNARLGAKAVKAGKAHTYWSASEYCWNKGGKYNSIL